MRQPKCRRKKLEHFFAQACSNKGLAKNGHALRALNLSSFSKNRERMLRISSVAKERTEEAAVIFQNFQFRMECDSETLAKTGLPFPFLAHLFSVSALHLFVIGRDDGFLAGEIVVRSACRDFGRAGNIPHGGDFEAAPTEQTKGSLQNQLP